jgi:hypothetical protein
MAKQTLLVAYDLAGPERDYSELIERLKQFDAWWHHLDSTWLVITDQAPTAVRDDLKRFIKQGDELLVIDVSGRARAWFGFTKRGSEWLHETYK